MAQPNLPKREKFSAEERANQRMDLRAELSRLETMLAELKVQYEQHFMGIRALAPDELHREVKKQLRKLIKAPFKSSAINYKLKSVENRYHSFHSYWERINKQREDGTYHKDVFKAELREKAALEEIKSHTSAGTARKGMQDLFNSYKSAIEQQQGKKINIDFDAFKKSLIARAKDIQEKHGVKKVSFKIKVKDGKVTVQATGK